MKSKIVSVGFVTALMLIVCGLVFGPPAPVFAQSQAPEVVVLEANGPVIPALANYIARGISIADRRAADAIVVILDTPGGNVTTMSEIVQTIRASDIPVIVYVAPSGALAGSAGLLVTLAGHADAMAPETSIGASSPIQATGQDLPTTLEEKEKEILAAQARSLAERRGDQAMQLASDAIYNAKAYSASEAQDAGLVDFVAADINDLLRQLDGFEVVVNGEPETLHTLNANLYHVPMSPVERVLILLTDPNIVFLLLSIGATAIVVEIRSHGWIAGVIGVTCVGLALYGLGILPVNWLGLVFIIMAFVLFLVDIKAPIHGALTAVGIVSMAVGAIILFNQPEIAPFGKLSIPLVIVWSLILGGIFAFMVWMAVKAQKNRPTTGYEGLMGQIGEVTQELDPVGMVLVLGERWKAVSEGQQHIAAGREVEVVEARRMRLLVRPYRESG